MGSVGSEGNHCGEDEQVGVRPEGRDVVIVAANDDTNFNHIITKE